jgi:hypothetical protein
LLRQQQRELAGDARFLADACAAKRSCRQFAGNPEMILLRREPVSAHLTLRFSKPEVPGGT